MRELLAKLKSHLGIDGNSQDEVLTSVLERAIEEARKFTRNDRIEEVIPSTIIQMSVIHFNKLKSEGLNAEGYSGVSFTYSADYPESVMRALKAERHIGVIR